MRSRQERARRASRDEDAEAATATDEWMGVAPTVLCGAAAPPRDAGSGILVVCGERREALVRLCGLDFSARIVGQAQSLAPGARLHLRVCGPAGARASDEHAEADLRGTILRVFDPAGEHAPPARAGVRLSVCVEQLEPLAEAALAPPPEDDDAFAETEVQRASAAGAVALSSGAFESGERTVPCFAATWQLVRTWLDAPSEGSRS